MGIYELVIITILGIIVIVSLILVSLAYIAANKLLKPPRRIGKWKPSDLGYRYEEFNVETSDGLKLHGWIIPRNSDKTILVLHGYTSSKYDEHYVKPVIDILARNNFNAVVLDLRAHGESHGELTTLGLREVEDIEKLLQWLRDEKPELTNRIGVIGYSMGGAIALMLGARSSDVKAIVADSPYMDIVASGRRWIMRLKGLMKTLLLSVYPLIIRFAEHKAGINARELRMINYAKKINKPVLIIAGRNDDLVSLDEIKEFYTILKHYNDKVELWITDSKHVSSIRDYPEEYEKRIIDFYNKYL